eukprot:13569509-Heterocapsa_arctica.AAC.1
MLTGAPWNSLRVSMPLEGPPERGSRDGRTSLLNLLVPAGSPKPRIAAPGTASYRGCWMISEL